MRVLALPARHCVRDLPLYTEMLRLRGRAFGHQLRAETLIAGDFEVDRFDALQPTYLLAINDERRVVGSVRTLPTLGPTALAETCSLLLGQKALPAGPDVYEASRLCIDPERAPRIGPNGVRCVTSVLLAGLIEWGLTQRLTAIVTMVDLAMERVLARAGWMPERLGEPRELEIGGSPAVADWLRVDRAVLARVRRAADLDEPVLTA